ncbi:hypothetical protein LTR84_011927 [Exophiala bonariae]|uniref:Uncharacterized protein n=1 Tax=Exophiala bonariae TaxID=1690606 RepID=A0AAV9MS60_9EURO|nr:hypothetical protein LTR84_011927 [Exophiala bonariae]
MDPGTAMAVLATVDLVINRAEEDLSELVVRLENRWFKVKIQVAFLKEWRKEMPPDLLVIEAKTVKILEQKLEKAEWIVKGLFPKAEPKPTEAEAQAAVPNPSELPALNTHSSLLSVVTAAFNHMGPKPKKRLQKRSKAKYAFYEQSLNRLVESIKDWQGEFDPTWYHILSL